MTPDTSMANAIYIFRFRNSGIDLSSDNNFFESFDSLPPDVTSEPVMEHSRLQI